MGLGIFKYSHIFSKIKAKLGKMLTEEDYDALIMQKNVQGISNYLKDQTYFGELIENEKVDALHRSELELAFKKALFTDATKLIKNTRGDVKKFYSHFYIRFVIEDIKMMLRILHMGGNIEDISASIFYFEEYGVVDLKKLMSSKDLEQFIENLRGTPYHKILFPLYKSNQVFNMFTAEMALDMYYFKWVLKTIKNKTSGRDQEVLYKVIGQEIDLINIMWIFRSKKYYHIQREQIYRYLIDYRQKLTKEQISDMVDAKDVEEFMAHLKKTNYSEIFVDKNHLEYENAIEAYICHIYKHNLVSDSFTMGTIISYLHLQEIELKNIITIIEGVRYNVNRDELKDYIILV